MPKENSHAVMTIATALQSGTPHSGLGVRPILAGIGLGVLGGIVANLRHRPLASDAATVDTFCAGIAATPSNPSNRERTPAQQGS
jgi:hypothetical protein